MNAGPTPSKTSRDPRETASQADRQTVELGAPPRAALVAVARPLRTAGGAGVHAGPRGGPDTIDLRRIIMTTIRSRLPRLLTVTDVAQRLIVSTKTVRRLIARGLPVHQVGRQIRISETDLFVHLEQNRK